MKKERNDVFNSGSKGRKKKKKVSGVVSTMNQKREVRSLVLAPFLRAQPYEIRLFRLSRSAQWDLYEHLGFAIPATSISKFEEGGSASVFPTASAKGEKGK